MPVTRTFSHLFFSVIVVISFSLNLSSFYSAVVIEIFSVIILVLAFLEAVAFILVIIVVTNALLTARENEQRQYW